MHFELCYLELHEAVSNSGIMYHADESGELRCNRACWLVPHRVQCTC